MTSGKIMKIFALNLSLHFISKQPERNYGYAPISMEELLTDFPSSMEFPGQQFYVHANNSQTFIQQVFELQSDTSWRESKLSICFIFENEAQKEDFLEKLLALFKPKEAAGGLVENERKEYLCIYNRDKWTLPKGHVEKGEEIATTAIREVQEETGIAELTLKEQMPTTYHTFKKKKKWILKITYWYKMFASSQQKLEPQAEEHIEDVRWLSQEKWLSVAENSYPLTRDMFVTEFTKSLS